MKPRLIYALLAVLLCALPSPLLARPAPQLFISRDGTFRFNLGVLVRCTKHSHRACDAYLSVCDNSSTTPGSTLVCFGYPSELKHYGTHMAAAFSVSRLGRSVTRRECLDGSPDGARSGGTVAINDVKFRVFHVGDAAMSHYLKGRVYRTFHHERCYELAIRVTWTNPMVLDPPGKNLTREDWKDLNQRLDQPLDSFRFLK